MNIVNNTNVNNCTCNYTPNMVYIIDIHQWMYVNQNINEIVSISLYHVNLIDVWKLSLMYGYQ